MATITQQMKDNAFRMQEWAMKEKARMDDLPPCYRKNPTLNTKPDQVDTLKWYIDMRIKPEITFNSDYSKVWVGLYV